MNKLVISSWPNLNGYELVRRAQIRNYPVLMGRMAAWEGIASIIGVLSRCIDKSSFSMSLRSCISKGHIPVIVYIYTSAAFVVGSFE